VLLGLLSLEGSKSKITMAWLGGVRGVAAVFDGLDGAGQSVGEGALADGADREADQPALDGLAVADHDLVHVGEPVGPPGEGVDVTGLTAAPVLESVSVTTTRFGSDQS